MNKIVMVLMGMITTVSVANHSFAATDTQQSKDLSSLAQPLSPKQAQLVAATVISAANAATMTVGAAVVSGTIISHIG
jgi:hypothetical protein